MSTSIVVSFSLVLLLLFLLLLLVSPFPSLLSFDDSFIPSTVTTSSQPLHELQPQFEISSERAAEFRAEWTHIEEVPDEILHSPEFASFPCHVDCLHALRHYTSIQGYVPIVTTLLHNNTQINSHNATQPPALKLRTVEMMLQGLAHMKSGNSAIVFRGLGKRPSDTFEEGKDYVYPSFASFSRSYEVAYSFAMRERRKGKEPIILVALSLSGRNITGLSCYPGEEEELHPPKTAFTVLKISTDTSFLSADDNANTNNANNTLTHIFLLDKTFGLTPKQALHLFENYFHIKTSITWDSLRDACGRTSLCADCKVLYP